MLKTFVTYEWVKVLVPSTVKTHTIEEAEAMFKNGEGNLVMSNIVELKREEIDEVFGVLEAK